MTTTKKIISGIIALVIVLAVASSVYNWYADQNKPAVSQCAYIPAPQPKIITKIKRVEVPGPERIITIEKEVVVDKLNLPDWVKTDANKQVIAVAEIQPYEGKTNAAAILDTKTGASEIIAKQIPLSFFGFENKKEIGIRAGYTTDGFAPRSTVFGRWQFLRVGNVHLGIYGEGNSGGEAVGQIELNYKF
jgi:hypothetical protein